MVESLEIPDLKTDVRLERLENLLKANERLDGLRERAQLLRMHGYKPQSFREMCLAAEKEAGASETPPVSAAFAAVLGVGLGAVGAYMYRNHFPRREDFGYLGGMMSGGSLGFAAHEWQKNKREIRTLEDRLQKYEKYLDDFELAVSSKGKLPDLNEGAPCAVPAR